MPSHSPNCWLVPLPVGGNTDPGFGIYVHWPFCAAKCPYCDFNSHVRQGVDHAAWRVALVDDISAQADLITPQTVTSVFFGGGTPSLMEPATVGAVLDRIAALFPTSDTLEVTLEANPTSVEAEKFSGFQSAGVNRISMGIQSLNDKALRRLGRMHSAAEAISAFGIARRLFDRVSFDLIYARQDQSASEWETELRQAMDMAVDHLSLYQLTIEAGTRFGELAARRKLPGLPSDDLSADMYILTQDICEAAGFAAYEVSNHARDGAVCQHNMTYWRYGPYLGVGPGAHGRIHVENDWQSTEAVAAPETWLTGSQARNTRTGLSSQDRGEEMLLMSLRLSEGLNLDRFSTVSGAKLNRQKIEELSELGLISELGTQLVVTPAGRLVLNTIISELCVGWTPV